MKVALVYDWVNTIGGAERILLALHKLFPNAPLFTSVYNKDKAYWFNGYNIKTSFLQKIPFAKSHHYLLPVFTPIAFESFDFSAFELVISVTSTDAKGIITKPETLHICYMLTPTRYLWSHENFYFKNPIFNIISQPAVRYLKKWDIISSKRPDYVIAISKTVAFRISQYYGRVSDVIYPPVSTKKFLRPIKRLKTKKSFLVISRLVPYKRVDIAIKTANELKIPLTIIGDGRIKETLKHIAGPTITFVNNLTEEELISYYQNCHAVIIPSEEDFGIVAVEAQAAGKPVICFGKGGATETVINNKTGIYFAEQNVSSLKEAFTKFKNKRFSRDECIKNAQKFSEEKFEKEFLTKIENYLKDYHLKIHS